MARFSLIAGCLVPVAMLPGIGGCTTEKKPPPPPISDIWEAPAPAESPLVDRDEVAVPPGSQPADVSSPAGPTGPANPIAIVNGVPIARSELVDTLIESHGLQLLEQLILLTAARQRAAQMSLVVTEEDISAEHADALERLATPVVNPESRTLDDGEARRLLDEFLRAKNISRREWNWRMEQRACLRKIAEAEVAKMPIGEDDLKAEYELAYGEKVQIRHIQVSSLAQASRVRALLEAGRDFELLVRQMSENEFTATNGGLIRPFTREDPAVTPLLRQVPFDMEVGQVSEPVREGNTYHIIRLERRFPASGVGFENVDHQDLRRQLADRLVRQRQQALEAELFQSAAVDIRHGALARQFREKFGSAGR